MQLTCDNCGSIQKEDNHDCELCGQSLDEEWDRKENGTLAGLLLGAVGATLVFCVAPAPIIKTVWFGETSWAIFLGIYALIWLVGGVVGHHYQAKDHYEFYGWGGSGFPMDNPFSLQDNYDRWHAGLGVVLFPMNVVCRLWISIFVRITNK